MVTIDSIKGMNDILPNNIELWQFLEQTIRQVMHQFAYNEIRTPILEQTSLFARSIGDATDIVSKEMFTFEDRLGKQSWSMRPEGTASCVRACMQHALVSNQQQQKLWYMGSMFRYERPQKGRYRQFNQLGVETFNVSNPMAEVEQLCMLDDLWRKLGINDLLTLEINCIGNKQSRELYKENFVKFLQPKFDELDGDSQQRLTTNPLRILDSKNERTQELLAMAPSIIDFLDDESKKDYEFLKQQLDSLDIKYVENNKLVRGLDYYNKSVFEWTTTHLGAQSAVCGGGRYDHLVEQLGGEYTPATGFAIGLERLILLLETKPLSKNESIAYLICTGEPEAHKILLAKKIREKCANLSLIMNLQENANFRNQFKKADKNGARWAFIVGDDEFNNSEISIKYLRSDKKQITLKLEDLSYSHLEDC